MKRFFSVFLILMLLMPMASTQARGAYLGQLQVFNCQEWVSLREIPNKNSKCLAMVPLGAYVEGYYYNSEFVESCYNGQWGYILSTYLSNSDASSSASSYGSNYLGKKTVINCNEFVTLRSQPSTSAGVVTRVAKGEEVDCYYYNNTFTYCYYNGMSGYILSQYLGMPAGYDHYVNFGSDYSDGNYLGCLKVVNCREWVSLRQCANKDSNQLAIVPLGSYVDAYYHNSEFAYCHYNGEWGYILSTYLSSPDGSSSAASSSSDYLGKKTVVNCNEFVTLRSQPSTTSSAVTRVAKYETVDCYYYDGIFTYCFYNGMSGYILSQYLG